MTADTFTAAPPVGCPSGLAPAEHEPGGIDFSPFVKGAGEKRLALLVRGAKCGGCLAKIERTLGGLSGVSDVRMNLTTGRLDVRWQGALAANAIAGAVSGLGYGVAPFEVSRADAEARRTERGLLIALGVAGFAMANVMLLSVSVWAGHGEMDQATRDLMHWISGAIALPAVVFAGQPFFRSAWAALSNRQANMDVPISLALILALAISVFETAMGGQHAYFDAAVMLCFFLLIGRYLDARLRRRAHAAAHELAALQATTATRIRPDGTSETVRLAEIAPGDTLLLAPGERAGVDMKILDGTSPFDEKLVTGESAPVEAGPGAHVYSGSINLGAAVRARALAAAEDSLVADIARMLEAGEQRRSAYRRIADRAVALYVPAVHSIALATLLGWLAIGAGLRDSVFVAVSTLIITCPCALALAAPVVQVVAASRLFRRGVYLKSGDALERLATADHIVFDKTGTLTLGRPVFQPTPESAAILDAAAALARASRHPLSRAVVEAAGPGTVGEAVKETPGLGLEGVVNGQPARLGSAEWVGAEAGETGASSLWFAFEDEAPVPLHFEDRLREDARETVEALKARGLGMEIVSGDRARAVAEAAESLGIDDWAAGATPADKAARLEALRANGRKVLMVGDGLNDAGALALAHASLAPGGAMDVSRSASDAVYSGEGLSAIAAILCDARTARARMTQNFALAALYNVIAVPIAVIGLVTPLVAALAMSASSLVVTVNALRPALSAARRT